MPRDMGKELKLLWYYSLFVILVNTILPLMGEWRVDVYVILQSLWFVFLRLLLAPFSEKIEYYLNKITPVIIVLLVSLITYRIVETVVMLFG